MRFEVLTKEEAARRARISPRHMHSLIRSGAGPTVTHLGNRVVVRTDLLEAWIEACTPTPNQAA